MSTLIIRDLAGYRTLDTSAMSSIHGGIYRTPPQILAFELTHLPATPDGRVLGTDGQLHVPVI
ncbi:MULTISPECIES: hypothetical protein [Cupriavidus]|uniref:Uncharacterized protein n=1 Tax=Cupriavidus oxalaticus TaxID=96344 RepID=A0A4P7LBB0_9BURK|nr:MULTISPECIES: hypothetical protein [Cupriavidus]MBF6991433.1 hypothetical protein [Cupriavidus sp. IK-TO18]QBY51289.1 hypothetical protein E0W60_09210 [Cupriavidus oxalaticus]TDF64770.1 hypothetical protein E1J61_17570 [Cupriavidus sp. L7L]